MYRCLSNKEHINVFEIISDCHKMHSDRLEKRGIDIKFEISPSLTVFIEKIGLAQVISNVILNAVEAIEERVKNDPYYTEKNIFIKAESNEKNITVKFRDNGIGIDEASLNKIFKYGFSTKNRSSGFGLHNCANFMKNHQGKIEIMSDGINQGATISLILSTSQNVKQEIESKEVSKSQ